MIDVLLALSALLVGLVAVLGGLMVLLRRQESGSPTGGKSRVKLPILGEIETDFPSLVSIFLGIALCFVVVQKLEIHHPVDTVDLVTNFVNVPEGFDAPVLVAATPYVQNSFGLLAQEKPQVVQRVDRNNDYNTIVLLQTEDGQAALFGAPKYDEDGKQFVFTVDMSRFAAED
jgi:hypothetical protein